MPRLDCETIFSELERGEFSVVESGPLHGPVTRFELRRDEDYSLILQTISDKESTSTFETPPAGTVRVSVGVVNFISEIGEAMAEGVTPHGTNTQLIEPRPGEGRKESSRIDRISWVAKGARPTALTVEWLNNCPTEFIWPASVLRWDEDWREVSFCGGSHQIGRGFDARTDEISFGAHRCCVHLCIEGINLFFGMAPDADKKKAKPGFILYEGLPDAGIRAKIRDALSFMAGRYFVYLGETQFDTNWQPVAALAVRGSTLNNGAFRLSTSPPSLLDKKFQNFIQPQTLEKAVLGILDQYDKYSLGSVFWNYWHAMSSPVHMAAVNFGAVFERLQDTYYEVSPKTSKAIVAKDVWKILGPGLLAALDGVESANEEKDLLKNKISNLNVLPQSMLMKKFLNELEIAIGSVEKNAWRDGRNRAAHGGKIKTHEFAQVIRENHVFQVLVNRSILAITQAADQYIDYYSFHHPARILRLGIPEPVVGQ